jgi:PPOX class probable F420-dependent enzyme
VNSITTGACDVGISEGMPKPPLPPELQEFLSQPNPAVIATLHPDGSPHTAATWYMWEDGRVLVNMDAGRKRLRHLRSEPHASITILGQDEWYRQVTVRGRATSIDPDPELVDIDRLARHYTGDPYPQRDRPRVSMRIDVDSWYAWAGGRFWSGQ